MKPLILLLALSGIAFATPPSPVVNVQGRAVLAGVSPTGTMQFKFAIGDAADTQTYWRHDGIATHGVPPDASAFTAPVRAGVFSVLLGDESNPGMTSLGLAVFEQPEIVLRIWVSDGSGPFQRLLPDRPLVASPYAVIAHSVEDGAITTDKIAPGAVTFDKIQSGAVGAFSLANNAVQSHALAPAVVTGDKVAPAAIADAQLAAGAVTTPKLADAAVTEPKLADMAVGTLKIADLAVTTDKIDHFAVGRGQIQNGAIDSAKIGFGEITANNLASASVITDRIFEGAVTESKLADGAVSIAKLAPGTAQQIVAEGGGGGGGLPPFAMVVSNRECDPVMMEYGYEPAGILPGRAHRDIDWAEADVVRDRRFATAIWSGTRIWIWGGFNRVNVEPNIDRGYIIDPSRDTVGELTASPELAERYGHTAVWTGTEMIIWGGFHDGAAVATGGRIGTTVNGWQMVDTSDPDAPAARGFHSAVWTGYEMIVWGGTSAYSSGTPFADGAAYNPVTNSWRSIAAPPASLVARWNHVAVWMNGTMVIHGGATSDSTGPAPYETGTGAIYQPFSDTWQSMPTYAPRYWHVGVAANKKLMVWGGGRNNPNDPWLTDNYAVNNDGAIFDFDNWTWEDIPAYGSNEATHDNLEPFGFWSGDRLAVHFEGSLALYDPENYQWTAILEHNYRPRGTTAWTGHEVIAAWRESVNGGPYSNRTTLPTPDRYLYRAGLE